VPTQLLLHIAEENTQYGAHMHTKNMHVQHTPWEAVLVGPTVRNSCCVLHTVCTECVPQFVQKAHIQLSCAFSRHC
jgi:hypothetical protein